MKKISMTIAYRSVAGAVKNNIEIDIEILIRTKADIFNKTFFNVDVLAIRETGVPKGAQTSLNRYRIRRDKLHWA